MKTTSPFLLLPFLLFSLLLNPSSCFQSWGIETVERKVIHKRFLLSLISLSSGGKGSEINQPNPKF
jgi:hypothetical protein